MSCVASMKDYVLNALSGVSGMKALLLDAETTSMIALVLSQTDVINREVFLTDRIDLPTAGLGQLDIESFHHLKAVVLIRPTLQSVQRLKQVLKSGKFKNYYIFFSNIADDSLLRVLAEGDEYKLVRQVTELYADYFALTDSAYHCNLSISKPLYVQPAYWMGDEKRLLERNSAAIVSLLLSFKVRADIRYDGSSHVAKMVAMEVLRRQKDESNLFTFQAQTPLLLVMDRVNDPVTPLLSQWTYQAMTHELIGIHNNRVSLRGVPGVREEHAEVMMSPHLDHFYHGNMYLNFGDLGTSVKTLVQNFQHKKQLQGRMDSIEDMPRFVDNMLEFRSVSGTVSKHVAIVTELSRLVEARHLMRVSELEQKLATQNNHSGAVNMLLQIMDDECIAFDDKLRLVLLYSLRYEDDAHNHIPAFTQMLRDKAGMNSTLLQKSRAVDALLKHAGSKSRGGNLFGNNTLPLAVPNIYMQHKPLLTDTLALIATGNLKATEYPYTDLASANAAALRGGKYKLIVVYMVGGFTYEESLAVDVFNSSPTNGGIRVVLGGSYVHNSQSFLDDILSGVHAVRD